MINPTFNPAYRVARCGDSASHGPHVMEHGPDQPRNCPGTGARRNPWCSNCGDTRGGPVGHEISECTWDSKAAVDFHDSVCTGPGVPAGFTCSHPNGVARVTTPGRQQLSGYLLRDYDQAVVLLRRAWISRGPTQDFLARRMGCPRSVVAAWLAGQTGAGPRRLLALADALGYDLALVPRDVPSDLPDLSAVGIGELTAAEVPAEAVTAAIERTSKPEARISGYNPQRLDEEDA